MLELEHIKKILVGHTSEGTAYTQHNYPYGYTQKCDKIYWVETTPNGQRVVTRTKNPKTEKWNNPKKGIYHLMVVLYLDDNDHIKILTLWANSKRAEIEQWEVHIVPHLDDEQKAQFEKVKRHIIR